MVGIVYIVYVRPGLKFESTFPSPILNLYGSCGIAVVSLNVPAFNIDWFLLLPVWPSAKWCVWVVGVTLNALCRGRKE